MRVGVEARIAVVEHGGRAHLPRRIHHAPRGLGPPGVGQRPVDVLLAEIHPVAPGDRVRVGVGVVARDHLRHRGGAGSEVDEHRLVGTRRGELRRVEPVGLPRTGLLVAQRPLALRSDRDHVNQRGATRSHLVDLVQVLRGHYRNARARLVDPILDVLGREQVGARHRDHPGLGAPDQHFVPRGNPRDDYQREVPLFSPELQQRPRKAVRGPAQVAEAVGLDALSAAVNGDERGLVRLPGAPVAEVEAEVVVQRGAEREVAPRRLVVAHRGQVRHRGLPCVLA